MLGVAVSLSLTSVASASDLSLRWLTADGAVVAEKTLSVEDVDAMPKTEFTTNTPWTEAPAAFAGPSLANLADLGGRHAVKADVIALDDYAAEIPAEDWEKHGAILAVRVNGETVPIREKGPYWVIYPIDSDPGLLNVQFYHARMVWQVKSIDFLVE